MPTRGKSQPDKVSPGPAGKSARGASAEKAHLMTESEIERTLVHLAHEIVDKTEEKLDLAIIGVRRRGELLGARLGAKLRQMTRVDVPVGSLDVELYRDDRPATAHPQQPAQISFSITGKDVILVDDVLFTGRTTRAALEALFDHGRPKRVRLCVLIDRGHRELPIEAAFVGKSVNAGPREVIEVMLREQDRVEKVVLIGES